VKHPDEGVLLSYLDAQLSSEQSQNIGAHVEGCPACQERLSILKARAGRVSDALGALSPGTPDQPDRRRALAVIESNRRQGQAMLNRIAANRRAQRVLAGVGVVIVLVGLFSLAPVRALARDFLGLFRVERFAVIPVDPERVEQIAQALDKNMFFGEEEMVSEPGEMVMVETLDEAAALAGFMPSMPQGFGQPDTITVMDGMQVRFTPDVEVLQAVLETLGLDPALLPEDIDGQPFDVTIPAGVTQYYNDGDPDMQRDYTIVQVPSPTVEVPDGVDMQALGEAMLQVLGMSPQEAARLSASIDWTTTLVLPIPTNVASVSEVDINGTNGLLFEANDAEGFEPTSAVIWQKNGLVTMVAGNNQRMVLIQIAESMEDN
jgi:hypothetical protein